VPPSRLRTCPATVALLQKRLANERDGLSPSVISDHRRNLIRLGGKKAQAPNVQGLTYSHCPMNVVWTARDSSVAASITVSSHSPSGVDNLLSLAPGQSASSGLLCWRGWAPGAPAAAD
jgi:hypothetical protein